MLYYTGTCPNLWAILTCSLYAVAVGAHCPCLQEHCIINSGVHVCVPPDEYVCVCVHVCTPNCVFLNFQLSGPSNQRTDMVFQNYHIFTLCAVLAVHSLLCLHTALNLLTASGEQIVCQCISIAFPLRTYVVCTCRVTMMSTSE